ncbi:MAG: HEAT repeat domain-containing protein [Planctomycetes bacterium]|nr:HEAT repeat domain-containing protein [Planctomycetota bacterium]
MTVVLAGLFLNAYAQDPAKGQKKNEEQKQAAKASPKPEEPSDTTADDQKVLREVGLGFDGPALLDYLRKRTFPDADPKQVDRLIRDMGDDDFETREAAFAHLSKLGSSALGRLKQVLTEKEKAHEAEIVRRSVELVNKIEAKAEPGIQAATARLIAKTKPAGAAEVILAYLPFAADQNVTDEFCKALGAVAIQDGKVEPALAKALEDKVAVKRAAAAEALVRAKAKDELPGVRKLLKDGEPSVRLRVAINLINLKDKDALPVLVECIEHLSPEQLWPAEEVLVRLAGDQSPSVSLGTTDQGRKAARAAWQGWLDKNAGKIDLAKLDQAQTLLGYTVIVQQGNRGGAGKLPSGEVFEIDHNKTVRWKFNVATYPVDAVVVGQDRVLIAEYQGAKVSERDFKGNVVWEKSAAGNPIGVQRMPNGNTLIVMQNRLLEVDRQGAETFKMDRPNHDIFRAKKLRNGEVVYITNSGQYFRIDKNNKILKNFQVAQMSVLFGGIDVLPNGGVVMPDFQRNRVVEFNGEGKEVSSFNVQWPNSVQRLPNGNTLVNSQNTRRIAEYDAAGREVWLYTTDSGMPFNARRR